MWKYIMLHCTATPAERVLTREDIDRYHRERGFREIGYHFIIHQDGRVEEGRALSQAGAHCKGWNYTAIGVAYIGGTDKQGNPKDTRTEAQKEAIVRLIEGLKSLFAIKRVLGHNEVSAKACPCYDVSVEN
ncbi:N-acetylmuramoyl-L-alanine amidase [Bacteroides sp. 51]|nr:N-acetylmuramoyl-L-alanine amidase [Bacteroides sp. 51]